MELVKQVRFNKGIDNLPDKLTATIIEEPYYLRIKIINLVFIKGFADAAEIVIDISDKDKLVIANYVETNSFLNLRVIEINKEYEFVISKFTLTIDENKISMFDFYLTYESINT
ncbi:MAG TPA: hypothetical protein VNX01_08535 [Bacteroidia bacterium]|jgi:hypothetical protein|nr:hypothetical protein [Bacteroidia bacterium]